MTEKRSQWVSIAFGLAVAGLFLFLTFRSTSLDEMWSLIRDVNPLYTMGLMMLSWTVLLVRGVRWWYLLPRPHQPGDMVATQRALIVSYGVNNLASRIGEVVRIVMLKRDTGRDASSITSTVVVDRILFDFLMFIALFALALYGFSDEITAILPQTQAAFQAFIAVTAVGVAGLFFLAWHPEVFIKVLSVLGLERFPVVWTKLTELLRGLSRGLEVCSKPKQLVLISAWNLLTWGLAIVYFWASVAIFGIELGAVDAVLFFTVSSLGLLLPSPGGLGTMHYFITLSLTHFLAVEQATAAAVATYSHGVNFIAIMLAALVCLLWKPKRVHPLGP